MPQDQWSPERERQYEHIRASYEDRGENEATAEEIAARTVNKERAREGETREASVTSIDDMSSARRGGPSTFSLWRLWASSRARSRSTAPAR